MLLSSIFLCCVLQDRPLTVERIFGGEFKESNVGMNGVWHPDGLHLVTRARSASVKNGVDIIRLDPMTGKREVIIAAQYLIPKGSKTQIEIESFDLSADGKLLLVFNRSEKVWRQNTRGDYWLFDTTRKVLRKLGGADAKPSTLMFAKTSPDGRRVAYVRQNNLYTEDVATGKITRLTQDGTKHIVNGTFDWVHEEELDLRDGFRWSPDSKNIAYWQLDTSKEPLFTMINNTDTPHPTIQQFPYPLAGGINASARIGVVKTEGGPTKWMDVTSTSETGYLSRMGWAANSTELVIQKLNRQQNVVDFRIANTGSGVSKSVFVDRDAAYVESSSNDTGPFGVTWVDGGKRFLTLSERDGWRHAYSVAREGGAPVLLTPGEFDVQSVVAVDAKEKLIYFIASPSSAIQRYLFVANLQGQPNPRRVTPADQAGTFSYQISPTGKLAFCASSRVNEPPTSRLISLPDHKVVRELSSNSVLKSKLKHEVLGETRFLELKTATGLPMDASLILPPNFDETKKYPIFFHVYGEP